MTNYNCISIDETNVYDDARKIFIKTNIEYLPVVDRTRNLVDIFSRKRAFYEFYFSRGNLDRMHYAVCVWNAAVEAVKLGVKAISVIEFGVAGGNGLLALEFHAREISKLFNIEIEVYSFDMCVGLPNYEEDYRDLTWVFHAGQFKMDYKNLEKKLDNAKLIIGDIRQTGKEFFERYSPAPIGAMMVDVDIYTSTKSIFEMLKIDYKYVQPRIYTYFDDIKYGSENIGENLAIKEFNKENAGIIEISPEGFGIDKAISYTGTKLRDIPSNYQFRLLKIIHFFEHSLYKKYVGIEHELPLQKIYL